MAKEMIFGWCKTGKHDKCRVNYGGDRITCICDCKDHGVNWTPANVAMTEEEIKHSIDVINREVAERTAASQLENRAIKSTSTVWGDQVSRLAELDEDGSEIYDKERNTTGGYGGYKYLFEEVQDATTIEELERRRLAKY